MLLMPANMPQDISLPSSHRLSGHWMAVENLIVQFSTSQTFIQHEIRADLKSDKAINFSCLL